MAHSQTRTDDLSRPEAIEARYAAARAQVEASQRRKAGEAGGLVLMALAYDDAIQTSSGLARLAHYSKLFCIAAAMVIPNLLVIRVLL